jgi:hypothetical protein
MEHADTRAVKKILLRHEAMQGWQHVFWPKGWLLFHNRAHRFDRLLSDNRFFLCRQIFQIWKEQM